MNLENSIMCWIDTGAGRAYIIDNVHSDYPDTPREEIEKTLDGMEREWLVINDDGHYLVTQWAHDGIVRLTGADSYLEALQMLADRGVHHYEQKKYGITGAKS